MSSNYFYLRYTWVKRVDVKRLAENLSLSFELAPRKISDPGPLSIVGPDTKEAFQVRADTLYVYLSPVRATLFQKERKPFTERDLELRKRIFVHYPRNRATPLPWGFSDEPQFEVKK